MKISLVATVIAAASLAGCASTLAKLNGPKLDYTEYAGEPVKSFYMNDFDGWTRGVERPAGGLVGYQQGLPASRSLATARICSSRTRSP